MGTHSLLLPVVTVSSRERVTPSRRHMATRRAVPGGHRTRENPQSGMLVGGSRRRRLHSDSICMYAGLPAASLEKGVR